MAVTLKNLLPLIRYNDVRLIDAEEAVLDTINIHLFIKTED